jgi:hypothetical protein
VIGPLHSHLFNATDFLLSPEHLMLPVGCEAGYAAIVRNGFFAGPGAET